MWHNHKQAIGTPEKWKHELSCTYCPCKGHQDVDAYCLQPVMQLGQGHDTAISQENLNNQYRGLQNWRKQDNSRLWQNLPKAHDSRWTSCCTVAPLSNWVVQSSPFATVTGLLRMSRADVPVILIKQYELRLQHQSYRRINFTLVIIFWILQVNDFYLFLYLVAVSLLKILTYFRAVSLCISSALRTFNLYIPWCLILNMNIWHDFE